MNRIGKRILMVMVLAGCVGLGTSAVAQDGYWRDVRNDRVDLRHDYRDVHRDQAQINHDRWELRRDYREGNYAAAAHERREIAVKEHDIYRDRRDIRNDRRDLYWDRR